MYICNVASNKISNWQVKSSGIRKSKILKVPSIRDRFVLFKFKPHDLRVSSQVNFNLFEPLVSEDLLQEMASKVEMSMKEYALQTIGALTCQHSANDFFVHQAGRTDTTLEVYGKLF